MIYSQFISQSGMFAHSDGFRNHVIDHFETMQAQIVIKRNTDSKAKYYNQMM